jgi:CRP-like cAMP-binding protein
MMRNRDPKVEALSTIEVLAGASKRELKEVCGLTTGVRIPAGKVLCKQGAKAEEVFLVVDGKVAVSRDDVPVGLVGAGGIVGEMALVDGGTRTATTVAVTDVSAFVLSASEFTRLLERFPGIAANVRAVARVREEPTADPKKGLGRASGAVGALASR